jgi:GNAT superfamily N-acetyltransferase
MTKNPLAITITKLEMTTKPAHLHTHLRYEHEGARVMLFKVDRPPVHFYRYLYDTVGRDHVWVDRRRMADEDIAAIVHDENVEIWVVYCEGAPAGYAELDFRKPPSAELAYFGLIPDFIGRGLGSFLLASAIDIAWSHPIERLWVHTNTLDHPRALPLYQKMGFAPYAQEQSEIVPL